MIKTYYRRPDLPGTPAALFDDERADVDPLTGAVPTWRLDEEPIYLETVRDLGVPGLDEPATPGDVIAGDVVEVDDPVVDDAPPTRALRLAPALAPDACPDCGALDPEPCRPKGDPVNGRPLTRRHRRRRALAAERVA